MSAAVSLDRPVPRWLHVWAVLTACATAALLAVGSLVTTFRAGMADKIWPTAPWHLLIIDWHEPTAGFLIEHSHRVLGYIVGGVTAILAIGLWFTDPRRWSRWIGLAGLVLLLAAYGQFHRQMMKQVNAEEITFPLGTIVLMAVALGVVLYCGISGLMAGSRASGLRLLGTVALAGVMIQGLLGGLRVLWNAWAGTDLAPAHGVFAQMVFCLLVALAVLTAKPRLLSGNCRPEDLARCRQLAILLTVLVFTQLIWGALVRHNPTPVTQRLHLLTAFAALAAAVWLIKSASGLGLGRVSIILSVFLALQLMLGVEAWMGKFQSGIPLERQTTITAGTAIIRTLHVLIGSGILATSVVFALLTRRRPAAGAREPAEELPSFVSTTDSHHELTSMAHG